MSTWKTNVELREEWVDYLGHVTAAAHLAIFEEARTRWLMTVMKDKQPAFVVVRQELDYRRELLMSASPVSVSLLRLKLGLRSLTVAEEIRSASGVHTESLAVLVRWDRMARCAMDFPPDERDRIARQMSGP